jgi:5-hydroxyisourate hydrolase-like protein (transthyretin family)
MTRRILLALLIASVAATGWVRAQARPPQPPPQRDTRAAAAAAPKGTAELAVLVSTDESQSQPLRRVSVSIQAGELDVPHIGVTDDSGRVVFHDLTAGNYLLTASRSGFVRTYYGSSLPGRGPGVAVTVLDAQRVGGINIRMLRGSVITGVLRSSSGRPAPNQSVQAMMVRSSGSDRRAVNLEGGLGSVITDDRGVYRIFGLAPGDYLVSVPTVAFGSQDMRMVNAEELRWADKTVSDAALAGGAAPPVLSPAPAGSSTMAYSPVYFPGTTVVAEATVVTLGPGEERAGVDFGLLLVPTAVLKGRVVDTDGRPQANVSIALKQANANALDLFSNLFNSSGRTLPDGTFTIQGVKPGSYALSVRATPKAPDAAGGERPAGPDLSILGFGGATTHWAEETVAVQGIDVNDITLTLRPGMTISGKIVYEATTKTAPTDLTKTALSLSTMSDTATDPTAAAAAAFLGGGGAAAKVAADGTFTVSGVAPGRYRLNTPLAMIPLPGANLMTGGWTLKGVMVGGRDIADAPLDVKAGADVSGVVVTFTDKPSELSGTVFDGLGRVTPNFPIVVFSTDRGYWTPSSRRVQTARPASDGQFTVTGLPAGEYYVCAVTAVDRTEVYESAFLDQLVAVSFKITIADGQKLKQDLRLGGK